MSVSLEKGVRRRIEDPDPSEQIALIVDLEEAVPHEDIEAAGDSIKVEETLPFQSLAVSLNEDDLEALCECGHVDRVEIEGQGGVLDSGN